MRIEIFRNRGGKFFKRWKGGARLGILGAGVIVCRGDVSEGHVPPAERTPVRVWPPTPDLASRAVLAPLDADDAPINTFDVSKGFGPGEPHS